MQACSFLRQQGYYWPPWQIRSGTLRHASGPPVRTPAARSPQDTPASDEPATSQRRPYCQYRWAPYRAWPCRVLHARFERFVPTLLHVSIARPPERTSKTPRQQPPPARRPLPLLLPLLQRFAAMETARRKRLKRQLDSVIIHFVSSTRVDSPKRTALSPNPFPKPLAALTTVVSPSRQSRPALPGNKHHRWLTYFTRPAGLCTASPRQTPALAPAHISLRCCLGLFLRIRLRS